MKLTHKLDLENSPVTGKLYATIVRFEDGVAGSRVYCSNMEELVMALHAIQQDEEAVNGTG